MSSAPRNRPRRQTIGRCHWRRAHISRKASATESSSRNGSSQARHHGADGDDAQIVGLAAALQDVAVGDHADGTVVLDDDGRAGAAPAHGRHGGRHAGFGRHGQRRPARDLADWHVQPDRAERQRFSHAAGARGLHRSGARPSRVRRSRTSRLPSGCRHDGRPPGTGAVTISRRPEGAARSRAAERPTAGRRSVGGTPNPHFSSMRRRSAPTYPMPTKNAHRPQSSMTRAKCWSPSWRRWMGSRAPAARSRRPRSATARPRSGNASQAG